jgi:hypothetical protein
VCLVNTLSLPQSQGEESGDHASFFTQKEALDRERVAGAVENMKRSSVAQKRDNDKKRN